MIRAAAKVNLNLAVTGRDETGYHQLLSLVVFTDFGDEMSLQASAYHHVDLKGPFAAHLTSAGGEQLLAKAAALYQEITGDDTAYHIELDKQIPLGGGLGGGSADAGAFLRFLCDKNAVSDSDIQLIRSKSVALGADVPACFDSQIQIMSSVGDIAHYCPMPDIMPHMVLVNPGCHADTKAVFTHFAQQPKGFSSLDQNRLARWVETASWDKIIDAGNDLTPSAMVLYPAIDQMMSEMIAKGRMHGSDFIGASMTGSGASAFALFQHAEAANIYETHLRTAGLWAVSTEMKQR